MPTHLDSETLQAALVGYQHQLDQIEAKMAELRSKLKGEAPVAAAEAAPVSRGGKRPLSAAARKRIAQAQRKRWAEYHKAKEAPAKKRNMSPAARERIAAATRKRWAEFRAKKASAEKAAAKPAKKAAAKKPAVKKSAPSGGRGAGSAPGSCGDPPVICPVWQVRHVWCMRRRRRVPTSIGHRSLQVTVGFHDESATAQPIGVEAAPESFSS